MKNKIIKTIALLSCTLLLGGCLAACSQPEPDDGEIKPIIETADLQRGHFYVETDEGFYEPVFYGESKYANEERTMGIALFTEKDFETIPTLYKGQHLVYRQNVPFDEEFKLAKYFDMGYTVGITAMEETLTGRYMFSAVGNKEDGSKKEDTTTQIWEGSDAWKLTELGIKVTLESIGEQKVRADMITECGTIAGLEKDKQYEAEIYTGTEYQPYTLTADTRVLYEVQSETNSNYRFIKKEIIEIDFPDYYQSGYYRINDGGIFRYIADEDVTWEDGMDINILNASNQEEADIINNVDKYQNETTRNVEIEEAGNYQIFINVSGEINSALLPEGVSAENAHWVTAMINLGDRSEVFNTKADNLYYEGYLSPSLYTVTLRYVYGRSCNIIVVKLDGENQEIIVPENSEASTEQVTTGSNMSEDDIVHEEPSPVNNEDASENTEESSEDVEEQDNQR